MPKRSSAHARAARSCDCLPNASQSARVSPACLGDALRAFELRRELVVRPVVLVDGLPDVGVLRDRRAHRHAAHQLDTTRDRSVDDARRDHRVREVGGLLRRTTLRVDRRRRHLDRQARGEPRVAGHVHRLHPDLADAPADHLADLERIDTRRASTSACTAAQQVDRVHRRQPAVAPPHRGAHRLHDHDFSHQPLLVPRNGSLELDRVAIGPTLCPSPSLTRRSGVDAGSARARRPWAATEASGKNGRMKITRGFTGRAHPERSERLPPGQYDTGNSWPVLTAEVTPEARHRDVDVHDRRSRRAADDVDVGRDPRAPAVDLRRRHPLRHHVVEVRHARSPASRSTRCSTSPRPLPTATHVLAFSHTGYTTNLPARRRHRRQGVGRVGGRRRAARSRSTAARRGCSCRTSTSGRAPSGSPACACSTTTSPASGSATATTTAATRGSSSATRATDARDRRRRRGHVRGRRRRSSRSETRPRARRRSGSRSTEPTPHRAGQHYVVRLTAPDGYTASRSYSVASAPDGIERDRAHRRAPRRRRGVDVPARRASRSATSSRCAARSAAGSCGTATTPGAARRRRLGRRAAHGDAAARPRDRRSDLVRLVVSVRTPDDLYYADELAGPETDDRLHARRAAVGRRARRAGSRADDLAPALLPDATAYVCGSSGLRRRRERPARRRGRRHRAHPGRALRPVRLNGASIVR